MNTNEQVIWVYGIDEQYTLGQRSLYTMQLCMVIHVFSEHVVSWYVIRQYNIELLHYTTSTCHPIVYEPLVPRHHVNFIYS